MTEDLVKRLFVRNRTLKAEVAPGYELLGEYLCADLGPIEDSEYVSTRLAVRNGLAGGSAVHNGQDFFLKVSGEESTIILMANDSSLVLPTASLDRALDKYEQFRLAYSPDNPPLP